MPEQNPEGYIILAEDNPADVYLVREALEEQKIGCELKVFSDGEEAVNFFTELDSVWSSPCPRLLLLDLHLPKLDGEAILKHVRSSDRCGQTPVVVLTSSVSARDFETAARHAALYYFQKPSSLEQFKRLGNLVRDVLNRGSGKAENTTG